MAAAVPAVLRAVLMVLPMVHAASIAALADPTADLKRVVLLPVVDVAAPAVLLPKPARDLADAEGVR